jgi:hypothetical protein
MANRGTITYNTTTISTEDRDGSFSVTYNNQTIATVGAGNTKTLKCSGKLMATDVVIGGKTLKCSGQLMTSDVIVAVVSLFPSTPSAYNLIGTYTSAQTWSAPEDGWFQIELHGASGAGGRGNYRIFGGGGGGGGGGGATAVSRVQMNKGDTITIGSALNSVTINSSRETYSQMSTTAGANGSDYQLLSDYAEGGAGGTASGGNYQNANGGAGSKSKTSTSSKDISGGAGGAAGYAGGNTGGAGGNVVSGKGQSGESGKAAFVKIYRGNTN